MRFFSQHPPLWSWVIDLMDRLCARLGGEWDRHGHPQWHRGVMLVWTARSGAESNWCFCLDEPAFGPHVAKERMAAMLEDIREQEVLNCSPSLRTPGLHNDAELN